MKNHLQTWKSFTKDPIALNAVSGVKLPLRRPPPLKCPNKVILFRNKLGLSCAKLRIVELKIEDK